MGAPQGTPTQFHPLSGRDPAASQYAGMQSGAANQIPLPVIAPRPLPQDDQMGSSSMVGMAGRGVSGDPYNPYGFAYESQSYPHNDLPPPVQHSFPPREASRDMTQDPYSREWNVRGYTGPMEPQPFSNQGTSESDSGIDMNQPGPPSDWSQSSAPSNAPSVAYAGHGSYGTSSTVSAMPGAGAVDPGSQIMYLNQPRVMSSNQWAQPVPGGHHDPWQSAVPPPPPLQQDEGMMNMINRRIQEPVRESVGTYQSLPWKLKISSRPRIMMTP